MNKRKVLIVDDEEKIRNLVELYLLANEYAVYTASNGMEALESVGKILPHIILLDIVMPRMNGFEVCQRLREQKQFETIPIIYLSSQTESESIITGLDAGADDYVTKPFDPNVLIAKINAILRRANGEKEAKQPADFYLEKLTFQEQQILSYIEQGYTNKEIADHFNLTEGTIKVYNHNLFQKLQVKNRTQAIVRAKEINLL